MIQDGAEIARLSAEAMWADDKASQGLGMEVLEVGPGRAKLAMRLTERMVNGHGFGHGGFIFTLADSALHLPAMPMASGRLPSSAASPFSPRPGLACAWWRRRPSATARTGGAFTMSPYAMRRAP